MKQLKKIIISLHRYLGISLCVLFLVWFLSGFVMLYARFPYLENNEKLKQQTSLLESKFFIPVNSVYTALNEGDTMQSLRMEILYKRPVYRFTTTAGKITTIYADNGEALKSIDLNFAKTIASDFYNKPISFEKAEIIHELDQWIPRTKFLSHMPIYRFTLNDDDGTMMYVSGISGEVIQLVTSQERFLAWLGPIPHWIYFRDLIINRPLWRQIIIWSSVLGSFMCLFGMIVGFIRMRKNKKNNASTLDFSPYKKRWFRWHHYTGFVFGLISFTWVFSGLLSMNPWKWSPDTELSEQESLIWQGKDIGFNNFSLNPIEALKKSSLKDVKQIYSMQFQNQPYYVLLNSDNKSELIKANDTLSKAFNAFKFGEIKKAVVKINPEQTIIEQQILNEYDSYYYSKSKSKPLPVYKFKMNDTDNTWYYVNPQTSEVVYKYQKLSRLERWLYNGLHSLDFSWLLYKRPLWDIVVIVLLLGGTALTITGLVLSWKWGTRKKRLVKKKLKKVKNLEDTLEYERI